MVKALETSKLTCEDALIGALIHYNNDEMDARERLFPVSLFSSSSNTLLSVLWMN